MRLALIILLSVAAGALASMPLRQSTAVTVKIGPMLDATDKVTPETALTNHAAHIRLSKNGVAFGAKNDATVLSHDENGYYACVLNATDTGTLGILSLAWTDANAVPIRLDYEVLTKNVYDSRYGPNMLDVNAVQIRQEMDTNSTQLAAIVADTNELQTDWTNGGRLDLLVDAIKAMTDLIAIVVTTVDGPNDANEFTITGGQDVNDAYWFSAIMVEDATDGHSEVRWIEEYSTPRSVLVDEPFSFTPAAADRVWILGPVYGGLLYEIRSALKTGQAPIYYYKQSTSGGSGGAGGTTYYDQTGDDP